jgi:hypothetical protein
MGVTGTEPQENEKAEGETVWRSVSNGGSLHLGDVTPDGAGRFRFRTRCEQNYRRERLWDDQKRRRCKRCLDTEATRERKW